MFEEPSTEFYGYLFERGLALLEHQSTIQDQKMIISYVLLLITHLKQSNYGTFQIQLANKFIDKILSQKHVGKFNISKNLNMLAFLEMC